MSRTLDRFLKRGFDLGTSFVCLIALLPLLLPLAVGIKVHFGGSIFFKHRRPGYRGRLFRLWKFKTMREDRDENGRLLPDAERLTSFGRWLRRTSLDELPEFWNVLKGEMSIVGPRPLVVQYLTRYTLDQARRHDVQPGVTGWAQVHGRNALTWEEKFRHDIWYVDHWSFGLDLEILGLTLIRVLSGEGISQPGHATMEEFMGTDPAQGVRGEDRKKENSQC
jgi:sugar transferase EpsL